MTDRPILFSAPMVRALLEGRKTQTRRILKEQPEPCDHRFWCGNNHPTWKIEGAEMHCSTCGNGVRLSRKGDGTAGIALRFARGDRLWVRESFARIGFKEPERVYYRADGENQFMGEGRESNGNVTRYFTDCWERNGEKQKGAAWKVSIHMPRWASRLTLIVTDVRVEPLIEISAEDCLAEGIDRVADNFGNGPAYRDYGLANEADTAEWYSRPIDSFRSLWVKINGAASWVDRPWVVALTFTVEKRNIDA